MGNIVFDVGLTEKTVNKQWTFKDLHVDVQKQYNERDIRDSKDSLAIQNGITNMFMFDRGERIIQPEFGNSLYKYLYEPITETTAKKIGNEIYNMFERWEPRVEITKLSVIPFPDQNQYNIEVKYTVPSLNNARLVFSTAVNARRGEEGGY